MRVRKRERDSICWFYFQMTIWSRLGRVNAKHQEKNPVVTHMDGRRKKWLEHHSLPSESGQATDQNVALMPN